MAIKLRRPLCYLCRTELEEQILPEYETCWVDKKAVIKDVKKLVCPKCGNIEFTAKEAKKIQEEAIRQASQEYFQNVTREQFISDLRKAGFSVRDASKTLYLLIGPSGVGKTTLGAYLKQWNIPELISHTTRPMRKGESYCNPYYFVDINTFYATEMVEYTEYNGYLYGTSKAEVDRVLGGDSNCAFAIVDRVGVEAFKHLYPEMAKVIYIYASGKDLIERMTARGDEPDLVAERIAHAYTTGEFNNIDIADYCIVNKDLDKAVAQLRAIVE